MKDVINGFAYSFLGATGKEHLAMSTFAPSRTKAAKKLKAENYMQRLQPLEPTGLWAVQVIPVEKIK